MGHFQKRVPKEIKKRREKWRNGFYNSAGKGWECRPYDRLVPLHALEKVAKIEAKFGDSVKFFVSDYVDPFIMVRPAMCHPSGLVGYNLVFDVWDEPGFGSETCMRTDLLPP